MALAVLADVKRVLRITTVDSDRDDQLTGALEAADDWFRARARGRFDEVGTGTAKFHAIRYGSVVHLPVPGSTITAVRAGSATDPTTLGTDQYTTMDDRRVRVGRIDPWPRDPREQEPLSWTERPYYEVVEIDYTAPGTVPKGVRDGIARLAASLWLNSGGGEDGSTAIVSEKIGDYEYKLAQDSIASSGDLWSDAMKLLRPYIGSRVMST